MVLVRTIYNIQNKKPSAEVKEGLRGGLPGKKQITTLKGPPELTVIRGFPEGHELKITGSVSCTAGERFPQGGPFLSLYHHATINDSKCPR